MKLKRVLIRTLSVMLVVVLTLTSAPLGEWLGVDHHHNLFDSSFEAEAAGNIIINGVDIGYANNSYFTKNGKSCANSYWSSGRCHNNGVCVATTHSQCNCMRYWPTGQASTCQVDLLASQCFGFVRYCQWKVYGYHDGANTAKFTNLGGLSSSSCTGDNLKNLLINCAPATHVRTKETVKGWGHSIAIISADSNGVVAADANSDGYCKVREKTYTWAELATYIKGYGGVDYAYSYNGYTAPDTFTQDTRYPTPIKAYPKATSGVITVYNRYLTAYSTSTRNIAYSDLCTINAVYTNGYCSVTYPTVSGGSNTEYAKWSDFVGSSDAPYSWSPSNNMNVFMRSNLSEAFGTVYSTDSCKVVAKSGNILQIIYPITGGYKMGWVNSTSAPETPEATRPESSIPAPLVNLEGKNIVVVAPGKITISSNPVAYISAGDVCIISNVNTSTGYCNVTYPSGGTDVFVSGVKQKTVSLPISSIIPYNSNATSEKAKIPEQLTMYPTSAMSNTVGQTTTNWWLDPGDEYTTINYVDGKTELLYYCTQGKHTGYWKLGWAYLDYYYLDLNGYLDKANQGGLMTYGTADIYINGIQRANDVTDFYSANGTYPRGSTYEIKDIRAYKGYTYNGVYSGTTSGELRGNTSVSLNFTKNPVTVAGITVTTNPTKTTYLEGEKLNTSGLVVTANFSDGSNKNVTSSCTFSGYTSTPGNKTVTVSYGGKTTAFTVTVNSKSPTKISITSSPAKLSYFIGESVDFTGLAVTATYDNGTTATVTDYDIDYDYQTITDTAGTKTVTVSYFYNNVTVSTTFNIIVQNCTYTVAFNGNGSTSGSMSNLSMVYGTAKNLTANAFVKTGYTFNGWKDGSGTAYTDKQSVNNLTLTNGATITLYAQWKANTYTVAFNGNGSTSGSMSNLTMTYDVAKNLTANAFAKTGYTFNGWNTKADGSGTSYADKASVKNLTATNGATVTLYAQWTANTNTKYVVNHYQMNVNGSGYTLKETDSNKTGTTGATLTIADLKKTYTGFTYEGGKGATAATATKPSTLDTTATILADGTRVINIYYSRNKYALTLSKGTGISAVSGAGTYYYGQSVTIDATVSSGYTWSKWSNDTTTKNATITMPANALTLTASATLNTYTITYNLNGGTVATANPTSYNVTTSDFTLNNPTKKGYTFAGWTGTGLSAATQTVTIVKGSTGNRSYTATWKANSLTVNFDANGGTVQTPSKAVTYDSTYGTLPTATRTGYTFNGWYTAKTGGTKVTADTKVTITGNQTLYAQWTANTYTIAFNGNGSTSGSMSNLTMTYDVAKNLTANAFAKTGYTFNGWNTKADGTGTSYANQASVKNLTATNGVTITLYAQWKANTYTIAFNGNGATSGSMSNLAMTYDTAKNLTANAFAKTGYSFNGWNTKADGSGTSYADKASVKNLTATNGATVTLYAQWTANTYTIAFNGNGSTSGSMSNLAMTYDTAKNLTANAFAKTGYSFNGWNTKADGKGTSYADKASVKNLTATNGATVTLYAQWKCNHNYTSKVTKEATCTVTGVKTYTCSTCSNSYTETIAALGHNFASTYTVDKAATCTEAGSKSQHCSRCTATQNATSIPAEGHNYTSKVTKEATCTATGVKTFTCSKCSNSYTETIAALGHNFSSTYTVDKAATCTAAGSKSQHCSRCTATQNATAIPAEGHNYTSKVTKEATCTATGVKTFTCSKCSNSYTETIAKKDHQWKAATCTAPQTCSVCNTTSGTAIGHSYTSKVTKEATCTATGVKTFTCSKCSNSYTETIAALGHNFASTYTVDKAATCTAAGSKSQHCSRCTATQNATAIPAEGHNYTSTVTKEATCTATGVKTFTCSKCSNSYTETIAKKDHQWKAATCTAPQTCSVCNTTSGTAIGHSYTSKVTKEATCTATGVKTYTCSTCSNSYTETIAALGHNFASTYTVDKAATCTEAGSKSQHCSRCTATQNVTAIPAEGHNYVSGSCSACGNQEVLATITVATVTATAGNQVKVAVSLKNNPGITSMLLKANYDTTKLQLVSVEDSGNLGTAYHSNSMNSPFTLSWANDTSTTNYTYNGNIVILTFKVKEGAALGATPITVTYDYDNYDVIDKDLNPVEFNVVDGCVNIIDVIIGDVNNDGKVNQLDRVALTRYLADWEGYTEDNINLIASDVNCDGKVNTLDRVILTRYIANWEGYESLPYNG